MKKFTMMILLVLSVIVLTACTEEKLDVTQFTVTFNSNGGSAVASVTLDEDTKVSKPNTPTKDGFGFVRWFEGVETDSNAEYDFDSAITADLTLNALWLVDVVEITDASRIADDIADFEANMYENDDLLDLPGRGGVYRSTIKWTTDSMYLSDEGVILPLPADVAEMTATLTGRFTLNDTVVFHDFDVALTHYDPVVLTKTTTVPFKNLTTEYVVEDSTVELLFEEDGSVPYIVVTDFFDLIAGFIDPDTVLTEETVDGILTISYIYYDEEEDETYDMILTVDSVENTIEVNDPGFYWAYVYSTETNYGRHIEYDYDNVNASYDEGINVIYDLDDFNMEIILKDGEVILPYYMTNQLFAGSSYYNVYYNYDGLYGIYSLPDSDSAELRTIQGSSLNNEDIPADLLIHNFNMLAFNFDCLYGLKDITGVETYYDLLFDNKDDLLSPDPEVFEDGIRELLLKGIDEPHTSYGYHSYYNKGSYEGPVTNDLKYYGKRVTAWYYDGLFATDDVIEAKWGAATTSGDWNVVNKPAFWFLDDTTVMLSLNDFFTADIEYSNVYDSTLVDKVLEIDNASSLLPEVTEGSTFWYYKNSTDTAKEMVILVKGATESYVTTYKTALLALGLTYNYDATVTLTTKANGYYSITLPGEEAGTTVDYMVQVSFDSEFNLLYISVVDSVPTAYDAVWPIYPAVFENVEADSAVYFELLLDQIYEQQPLTENIILDLSWNTGGNIGALYRIVGFITDNPFQVSGIDGATGGTSTSYVDITNEIPSYADKNWSLLTTPTTFSAANEMAAIFMSNDLGPIIGVVSGGGACSITPILLPTGTAFTMSSKNIGAYRTGAGTTEDPYEFHNTEYGITPDFEIEIEDIYNATVLLETLY